jgi:Dockerin type I domain
MGYHIGQFLGENARMHGRHYVTWLGVLCALSFLLSPTANAQIDTLQVVVNNANAVGGVSTTVPIGAFGYDPATNSIYVAGFPGPDQELRRIDNVDGSQVVTPLIFSTAWNTFTKGGNLNNSGGSPTPSALLFNPAPISSLGLAADSNIWVMDGSPVVNTGSPAVNLPGLTQRLYRYNLAQDTTGNASNEFTSVLTLAQFQAAAGTTSVLSNSARQYAWSGDGQSLYFTDTAPGFGGLWHISAAGGTPVRLLTGGSELNTEPAVTTANGVDTIYLGGTGANAGGIDKITYDGSTASARQVAVSAATLDSFFDVPAGTSITIGSMASDANGDIYFSDTSNPRKGIYGLDPQGRLFKVASFAERQAAFQVGTTSINSNTLRMQPRTTTFTGANGSFPVTQILYQESSPYNFIAGAYVFKPGDFNRDNLVDQSDIQLFKPALTVKGVTAPTANLKFDLNGDNQVNFDDVKILQQFDPFPNGDANMDDLVNITDLRALAADWQQSGQTWTGGDFTGEGVVNETDLDIMRDNWSPGPLTFDQALLIVGLPEPSVATVGSLAVILVLRRRHRS